MAVWLGGGQRCPARTRCWCSCCPASTGSGCRRVSSSWWRSRSACSARQVPHGCSDGLGLAPRRWRRSRSGRAIVIEGYGGPMQMAPFNPDQRTRATLNTWLRHGPPGAVLEIPIAGPELSPFTLVYRSNTLFHRHPIINGYSGYGYALQDFLGGPGSPIGEPDALPDLLTALREIGVRYVVVHPALLRPAEARLARSGPARRCNRPDGGRPGIRDAVRRRHCVEVPAGAGEAARR